MKKNLVGSAIVEKLSLLVKDTKLRIPKSSYDKITSLEKEEEEKENKKSIFDQLFTKENKAATSLKAINEILTSQFDNLKALILKINSLKNSATQEELLEKFSIYMRNCADPELSPTLLNNLKRAIDLETTKQSLLETEDEKAWSKIKSDSAGESFFPEIESYIELLKSKKDRREQLEQFKKEWKEIENDVSDEEDLEFKASLTRSSENPNDNESLNQAEALLKRKKAWSENPQRKLIVSKWQEIEQKVDKEETKLYLSLIHDDLHQDDSLKGVSTLDETNSLTRIEKLIGQIQARLKELETTLIAEKLKLSAAVKELQKERKSFQGRIQQVENILSSTSKKEQWEGIKLVLEMGIKPILESKEENTNSPFVEAVKVAGELQSADVARTSKGLKAQIDEVTAQTKVITQMVTKIKEKRNKNEEIISNSIPQPVDTSRSGLESIPLDTLSTRSRSDSSSSEGSNGSTNDEKGRVRADFNYPVVIEILNTLINETKNDRIATYSSYEFVRFFSNKKFDKKLAAEKVELFARAVLNSVTSTENNKSLLEDRLQGLELALASFEKATDQRWCCLFRSGSKTDHEIRYFNRFKKTPSEIRANLGMNTK